jgi:hypothetical protein
MATWQSGQTKETKLRINQQIMKLNIFIVAAISVLMFFATDASAQQQDVPSLEEQIEKEAERLERVLGLEDWQVFYVDSTLMHDFPAMQAEMKELAESKVANRDMYIMVQDKWMDQIDATYKRIFTEEQWAAYLKQGAAKAQKARAKRKVKN